MATNNNQNGWLSGLGIGFGGALSAVPEQQQQPQGTTTTDSNQYEQPVGSNTLKRNPKMELSKNDLLKLVTYFEGEVQARDVAIAALKSEKLKQVVNVGRYRPVVATDPYTALLRDSIADGPKAQPAISEHEMAAVAEQQLQALEQLALQQKQAHQHMINILKDAEAKHRKVIQDLEEEKFKHEHDTAQGDDITYGLEMERTRLKQELEMERTARKKLEKEVKKQIDMADEERARQKQIVLLLLAERKKIIVKYIEERKRSEDLAQILSEEKSRIDSMAEGLEEESKKSLQMEAELEKQVHVFESDKRTLNAELLLKDVRCHELEAQIQKLKGECEALRSKANASCDGSTSMISSVAKVVQPTATVSSVPVSGPTTGIAQSVTSGQGLRQGAVAPPLLVSSNKPLGMPQQPSTGSRPSPKGNFTSQYQTTPPQTPPKKGAVASRGVPPPIPPNKPVIPIKQTIGRRADVGIIDDKKKTTSITNIAGEKESGASSSSSQGGIEILGQELADFQQMFVTMATSNNT